MNTEFTLVSHYFEEKSKLIGKIATYDLIIEGMEKAILESTVSGHLVQYELDDGQMKVRTMYRSIKDMTSAMQGLIKLRQMYVNKHNGSVVVLTSGKL